jgi:putative pre-16S rRNA nuclease
MPEARRLLLAFDYGLKRIGVATANGLTRTASPLTTLATAGSIPWPAIDALVAEWQPNLILVGRPGTGANPKLLVSLDAFIEALRERYRVAVEEVDESFTSVAAEASLRAERREGILRRPAKRGQIDQRAACLIAEQWMNQALE